MGKDEEKFEQALQSVHVPVLTLDHKWHRLFRPADVTTELKNLEKELNNLVKLQGKVNTEIKDLKKLKNNLMKEIVNQMDDTDKEADKKTEENKRLISEINQKIEDNQDQLLDLPHQIDDVNRKLMLETMDICYDLLQDNTDNIEEIGKWIKDIRVQLKKNVIRKQEMEIKNVEMYSYMHDIFGPKVTEMFDIRYNVEAKKQEILNKQRAAKEKAEREKAEKEKSEKVIIESEEKKLQNIESSPKTS